MNSEDIDALKDFKIEAVEVPQWNATVHVRELSAGDWCKLRDLFADGVKDDLFLKSAVYCLCDEDGELLYPDSEDGCKRLAKRNSMAVFAIGVAGLKANGIDLESKKKSEPSSDEVTVSDTVTS